MGGESVQLLRKLWSMRCSRCEREGRFESPALDATVAVHIITMEYYHLLSNCQWKEAKKPMFP